MASDEQIQAAMPAMREWLRSRNLAYLGGSLAQPQIAHKIGIYYPGGVDQFITDQEESHGA